MTRAYVGLGANLGARRATIRRAVDLLAADAGIDVVAVSDLIETDPVGYLDQPRFINGVAEVETSLSPRALLDALLRVERTLGRTRDGPRHGPRSIDLDLLLYGDRVVDEPALRVPHPELAQRRFVLEPLAQLNASLDVPGHGPVATLLAELD